MKTPTPHKVGYARVSSVSQNLDSQIDALKQVGCGKIFADKASGIKESRQEWDKILEYLRPGDTLVMTELSRMSRSLMHLLSVVKTLEEKGVHIVSLRENIDTATATGRFFVSMMGAISQMERELKAERASAGRAAAKARGRTGGRPRTAPEKLEQARILYENSNKTAEEVCKLVGIGKRTLFKHLSHQKQEETGVITRKSS